MVAELGPVSTRCGGKAVNVRRGLARLWVVASIGWITFAGIDAIRYLRSDSWEFSFRPNLECAFGSSCCSHRWRCSVVGRCSLPQIAARSQPCCHTA
jgi:hypothetical protein